MRWLGVLIATGIFLAITGAAYLASASGWGLPGELDQPVSVRQDSIAPGHQRAHFLYFGTSRRHFGGGYHGGK